MIVLTDKLERLVISKKHRAWIMAREIEEGE